MVIIGAGGVGLMGSRLLKAMGGKGAIVVDIDPVKRDAAMKAGAIATIDGKRARRGASRSRRRPRAAPGR